MPTSNSTNDEDRAEQLLAVKTRVENNRQESARAQGALEQIMGRLKSEYGCRTMEEAEAKLEELNSQTEAAASKFDRALEKFQKEYGEIGE